MLESDNFKNEVNSQVSNVLYLADILQRIREFIPSDETLFISTIEGVMADFTRENGVYDQVRFLDNNGKEIARVNWVNGKTHVVPTDELQDKSDRYFYQESLDLKSNQVYISKFDLNMEYSGIELPIKPVYRLISPVDLTNGKRLGYIVVNILGRPVLNHILEIEDLVHGSLYLVNEDGDWIIAPPRGDGLGIHVWRFRYGF